jgi:predicted methyltransferase
MENNNILHKVKQIVKNPDAIIDTYDLSFVFVSEKCCKLTEFSRDELVGNQIFVMCQKYKEPCEIEINMQNDPPQERIIPIVTKSKKNIKFKIKSLGIKVENYPYHVEKYLKLLNNYKKKFLNETPYFEK